MQRIAIIGASGQLGGALVDAYAGRDLLAPSHRELDFEDAGALGGFVDQQRPDVLINCTAFHNVDECEREPERAFAVNALAVDRAAAICADAGTIFATISTDYVFDGTLGRAYREDDAANPLTAYGVSKLAGELLVRRHGERHLIFRLAGVYSASGTSNKGYTFIERILQQGERGEAIRVVDDMTFSPTYAPHAAAAIRDAIDARAFGTHHVTNGGAVTWHAFATAGLELAGIAAPVEAISYASFGARARRPLYSPLVSTRLEAAGVAPPPPWRDGLIAYVAGRRARTAVAS